MSKLLEHSFPYTSETESVFSQSVFFLTVFFQSVFFQSKLFQMTQSFSKPYFCKLYYSKLWNFGFVANLAKYFINFQSRICHLSLVKCSFLLALKNGDHFFTPTSPKIGGLHICVVRLPHLGGFSANFEFDTFWAILTKIFIKQNAVSNRARL